MDGERMHCEWLVDLRFCGGAQLFPTDRLSSQLVECHCTVHVHGSVLCYIVFLCYIFVLHCTTTVLVVCVDLLSPFLMYVGCHRRSGLSLLLLTSLLHLVPGAMLHAGTSCVH